MTDLIQFGKLLEERLRQQNGPISCLEPYLTVVGSVTEGTR